MTTPVTLESWLDACGTTNYAATRSVPRPSECTKSIVGCWGFAPDPTRGAYSAPPDPLTGFKGPTSKGRGEEGRVCLVLKLPLAKPLSGSTTILDFHTKCYGDIPTGLLL